MFAVLKTFLFHKFIDFSSGQRICLKHVSKRPKENCGVKSITNLFIKKQFSRLFVG